MNKHFFSIFMKYLFFTLTKSIITLTYENGIYRDREIEYLAVLRSPYLLF